MIITHEDVDINSQLIVQLAEQALRNYDKKWVQDQIRHMRLEDARYLFGMVKIDLPRRSGHTTAGLQLLAHYEDSLMFFSKADRRTEAQHALREYVTGENLQSICDRMKIPSPDIMRNIKPLAGNAQRSFVIIDNAKQIREEAIEVIMQSLNPKIFVVLQH